MSCRLQRSIDEHSGLKAQKYVFQVFNVISTNLPLWRNMNYREENIIKQFDYAKSRPRPNIYFNLLPEINWTQPDNRKKKGEKQITYWWIDDFYGRSLCAINKWRVFRNELMPMIWNWLE